MSAVRSSSGSVALSVTLVLEKKGSAGLLNALSRTNLFLVSLDDDGEWFRFHPHFFGEMLRMELVRRDPASAATLHRRAYEWHTAGMERPTRHRPCARSRCVRRGGELIKAAGFTTPTPGGTPPF